MNRESFNVGYVALVNAFSHAPESRLDNEAAQEIYWLRLQEIGDQRWHDAVAWCLDHCKFFPSIAELGTAAFDGNPNWAEMIERRKRLDFNRKMRSLAPPLSPEERKKNQREIVQIASNLGNKYADSPKQSVDERKAQLKAQAEKLKRSS